MLLGYNSFGNQSQFSNRRRAAMNLTVPVSPETQAELQRRAVAAGRDLTSYVAEALREHLAASDGADAQHRRTYDEWSRMFREWLGRQKSRNPSMDDSRESIYN